MAVLVGAGPCTLRAQLFLGAPSFHLDFVDNEDNIRAHFSDFTILLLLLGMFIRVLRRISAQICSSHRRRSLLGEHPVQPARENRQYLNWQRDEDCLVEFTTQRSTGSDSSPEVIYL